MKLYQSPKPIAAALKQLYKAQALLKSEFSEWSFPLDGKLVGDIGEVIAMKAFGLTRLPPGQKSHDFKTQSGKLVQVKATQKNKDSKPVGLGLQKQSFEHLLVIEFDRDGFYEVLYNGPGSNIDRAREHKSSASLSRRQLRELQSLVQEASKLQAVDQTMAT